MLTFNKKYRSLLFSDVVPFTIYLLLAVFFLRTLLFTSGTLGHNWDWVIPPLPAYLQSGAQTVLSSWSENLLGYPAYIGRVPEYVPFLALGYLGLDGELVSKLILLIPTPISCYFGYRLAKKILRRTSFDIPSFLSGLLFGFSGASFNLLLAGSLPVLFGFALAPVCISATIDLVGDLNNSERLPYFALLKTIFVFSLMSMTSTPNFVLACGFSLLYLFFAFLFGRIHKIKILGKSIALFILSVFLSSFFVVIPMVFYAGVAGSIQTPQGISNPQNILSLGSSPFMTYLDSGFYARDMYARSVSAPHFPLFLFCASCLVLVAVLPLLKHFGSSKSREQILFWVSVYTISVGFAAGDAIIGFVIQFLYNIPIFLFLRSLSYYLTYVGLGLAVAVGLCLNILLTNKETRRKLVYLSLFSILIIAYLLPWFNGDLGRSVRATDYDGTIDNFRVATDYDTAFSILAQDNDSFNILAIPMSFCLYYFPTEYQRSSQSAMPDRYVGAEPTLINSKHGVITGDVEAVYTLSDQTAQAITALKQIVYTTEFATFKPLNSVLIAENNQTSFWSIGFSGNGTNGYISENDSADLTEESVFNVFQTNNGSYGAAFLYHIFPDAANWAFGNTLYLDFYGRNDLKTYTVKIYAPDASNVFFYQFNDDFVGWKQIAINLLSPYAIVGNPKLEDLREIQIYDLFVGNWHIGNYLFVGNLTEDENFSAIRSQLLQILSIFNVKYVLFLKYVAPGDLPTSEWNSSKLYNFLINVFQGGTLVDGSTTTLFRVPSTSFTPRVYIPDAIVYCDMSDYHAFLENIGTIQNYSFKTVFVDDPTIVSTAISGNATIINWMQISPTEYQLLVNSAGPYAIVLAQSYNNLWAISVTSKQEISPSMSRHFVANGFENGWCIDMSGLQEITISFSFQSIFSASLVVSCLSLGIIGGLLVIFYTRGSQLRRATQRK